MSVQQKCPKCREIFFGSPTLGSYCPQCSIENSKEDKIYNTSLKEKQEYFNQFMTLIKNQFDHGGDKYQLSPTKEMTDLVCELVPGDTGVDWVLGTMLKYLGRFKNFEREKDLLKIATYCYIAWLKKGYQHQSDHDEDIKK